MKSFQIEMYQLFLSIRAEIKNLFTSLRNNFRNLDSMWNERTFTKFEARAADVPSFWVILARNTNRSYLDRRCKLWTIETVKVKISKPFMVFQFNHSKFTSQSCFWFWMKSVIIGLEVKNVWFGKNGVHKPGEQSCLMRSTACFLIIFGNSTDSIPRIVILYVAAS